MLLSRCSAALPDEGHHAVAVPPKGRPLHSVIAETLANVELLLAQLEAGVRVADSQRGLVRDLFVATQRQREVLSAALRLEDLE